jgi:hypothetical protein
MEILERMGFEVERHKNHFIHDEYDDKWIPPVTSRQWVILSGDKLLSRDAVNIEAVRSSKAQVIMMTDTNSLPEQWAASIIVGRHRLQELLDKHPGPVFIKVGKQAKDHVQVVRAESLERRSESPATPASAGVPEAQASSLENQTNDGADMRLPTPPDLPEGGTPAERLDLAFRKVLTVPKEALVKEEEREKAEREKKRVAKKPH